MTGYRPMTLVDLASRPVRAAESKTRWKLVWEFLEEYRWEPEDVQSSLLRDEPPPTGDERWDALLAAVAEHLAAQHDLAPPEWAEMRVLQQPWFPAELKSSAPMHWPGRQQHSGSMASTFPPGTWRPRERGRQYPLWPGRA